MWDLLATGTQTVSRAVTGKRDERRQACESCKWAVHTTHCYFGASSSSQQAEGKAMHIAMGKAGPYLEELAEEETRSGEARTDAGVAC